MTDHAEMEFVPARKSPVPILRYQSARMAPELSQSRRSANGQIGTQPTSCEETCPPFQIRDRSAELGYVSRQDPPKRDFAYGFPRQSHDLNEGRHDLCREAPVSSQHAAWDQTFRTQDQIGLRWPWSILMQSGYQGHMTLNPTARFRPITAAPESALACRRVSTGTTP